jgi:hypothetical protein
MRNVLLIIILLASNFSFCQETEKLTVESLKLELVEFLMEKNQIRSNNKRVSLSGIHKNRVDENLKNGIYVFNNGSTHNLSFFVIVDNNSFSILDISTSQGLKDSIETTLKFAKNQKYCAEITQDYISRLIGVHYRINKNPRGRNDKNCEFELKPRKSTYDLNALKLKLAEFLVEKKELNDIDQYFKYSEFLLVSKMDIYYGVEKEKKVECGVYTFAYIENDEQNFYYAIVNEDWIEIFSLESSENLYNGINKVLDFAENHNYCHSKIGQIIEQLIGMKYLESCFDNPTFELP